MDKILITLATGKTGFAASKQLIQEGNSVRIYVRTMNKKALELERLGAEIVLGDFSNKIQLKKALEGIKSVYYCYPYKSGMVNDINLFTEIAIEEKVYSVVFMGQRIAEMAGTGSALTEDIRKSYEILENSGLNVVYFAPGYFADNIFVLTQYALQLGIMPNPFGSGKNPWISIDDMSRCIVALLKNPSPYFGQKIFPTGDQSIASEEIVKIFSKVRGKKVIKVNIPDWLFFKGGIMTGNEFGFDKYAIVQSMFYDKLMQQNHFNIEPTNVVKELTGRDPENFETITKSYFDHSKYKQRTLFTWLNAFIKFNKIIFTKVPTRRERAEINV